VKSQRLRFCYGVSAEAASMGSRDIASAWVDALSKAGFAVAVSGGKRTGPLVSMAAPLPQGATSGGELIDVYLETVADPQDVLCRVSGTLPAGITPVSAEEVGVGSPSLQSQLRWAEYDVDVPALGATQEDVLAAVIRLLQAERYETEHRREKKVRQYDLRPLVLDIRLEGVHEGIIALRMRLRAEAENTARADQTCLALGLAEPARVHRVRLFVEQVPDAVRAFRLAGEREGS
jgi:radical SAM-linked protein